MKDKLNALLNQILAMIEPLPAKYPTRLKVVKSLLWFLSGVALAVAIARFSHGLGSATALTDRTPWGFWIGFDVMGGVALAAGGFIIAATVYIFHIDRYHAALRPAVLTAFLGYGAVIVGLLFDLGLPWNIWHAMIYWNFHSALFEVAWCVMLYFTVLFLEFTPVVLERSPFKRLHKIMHKLALPLVILGIMLSTLHQSSLGTLFLIMPFRLHALWYTPILPVLFFISAVGLGICMVMMESTVTSWLYGREREENLVAGLAKAAAVVLAIYAALRLGDIVYEGKAGLIFERTWDSALFIFEVMLSAIVPLAIFAIPRLRKSPGWLTGGATMVVLGFAMNRIDVGGLATVSSTGSRYIPSWMEISISVGVVSAAALMFFFFVERFHVYETEPVVLDEYELPPADPVAGVRLMSPWNGPSRQYSLIFILAVAIGFLLLPDSAIRGAKPLKTSVSDARFTTGLINENPDNHLKKVTLFDPASDTVPAGGKVIDVLLIDGNRDGRSVLFDHKGHQRRMGEQQSCGQCHHMNKPLSGATPCYQCHSDMYHGSDIFDHNLHMKKMGGNKACVKCHTDPALPKNRVTTTKCIECHKHIRSPDSLVKVSDPDLQSKDAVGYMQAMHGLCIPCHEKARKERPELGENFARCATCHEGVDMGKFKNMEPYAH